MPSKRVNNIIEKIVDTFDNGRKKEPVVVKEDITAKNRKNALQIIGILAATDIERSRLSDELKEAGKAECGECDEELHRQNLITELERAPAITDDMSDIDKYNLKFAQYYKEAAEKGQNSTFHWAGNALARGLTLRQNLRMEDEEFRIKDKDYRLEQMEDYDKLLLACKAIDDTQEKQEQWTVKYNQDAAEFNRLNSEIKDYLASNEGGAAATELDTNPEQASGAWSAAARQLNNMLNELAKAEITVSRSGIWMNEAQRTLEKHQLELQGFREKLLNNPDIYDAKLAAEFTKLMGDQQKALETAMYRNNEIRRVLEAGTRGLETIATESEEAKERSYWNQQTMANFLERAEKEKVIIEAGPSQYAYLKEKEVNVNTQRQMNSMD